MSKRTYDACGEKKQLSGGKTCENGHFICSSCKNLTFSTRKQCPLCKKALK